MRSVLLFLSAVCVVLEQGSHRPIARAAMEDATSSLAFGDGHPFIAYDHIQAIQCLPMALDLNRFLRWISAIHRSAYTRHAENCPISYLPIVLCS